MLSRSAFMAGRPIEAIREAERAVAVLGPTGDIEALAYAETYLGAVQALTDRQDEALARLLAAQALAQRAGRRDLVALCHNYIGCARVDLGDVDAGLEELRRSLWLSLDLPHHEYAGSRVHQPRRDRLQLHRYDELATWIDAGLPVHRRPRPARAPAQPGGAPCTAAAQPGALGRGPDPAASGWSQPSPSRTS